MVTKKDLNYYLNLNWTYTIERETHKGQSYYIIRVNELPGVCTDAPTVEEGMKEIQDVIQAVIELYRTYAVEQVFPL
jgi:predicted RNase H-like HicB family nuclease